MNFRLPDTKPGQVVLAAEENGKPIWIRAAHPIDCFTLPRSANAQSNGLTELGDFLTATGVLAGRKPDRLAVLALSYEWGCHLLPRRPQAQNLFRKRYLSNLPLIWAAVYENRDVQKLPRLAKPIAVSHSASPNWEKFSNLGAKDYGQRVEAIRRYIAAGDLYQANLAQCWTLPWQIDRSADDLFERLWQRNPGRFSAHLHLSETQSLLSCSPERFLRVDGKTRKICAEPIKGTLPRGQTPAADRDQARRLYESAKNQAELTMIVDLMRNDLGKLAIPGSVRVPARPRLESYASVHHLVSTIEAELPPQTNICDILAATLPGGSVTGAPKIRACEIIAELEPTPRGFFTGAIGTLAGNGDLDLSIAIRTLQIADDQAWIHAGAAITADSDANLEYAETLAKVAPILQEGVNIHERRRKNPQPRAGAAQTQSRTREL